MVTNTRSTPHSTASNRQWSVSRQSACQLSQKAKETNGRICSASEGPAANIAPPLAPVPRREPVALFTYKRPLLLDLFCGAGGCAVGYNRAGFDVVGVDIQQQSRYPFQFVQADAMQFLETLLRGAWAGTHEHAWLLSDFDAIHASPPCQAYSVTAAISKGRKQEKRRAHPDLVATIRQLLELSGMPWVIENVVGAPLHRPVMLCGLMFGLRVLRHRVFESSELLLGPAHPRHPKGNLTNSSRGYSTGDHGFVTVAGHNFVRTAGARALGIDWMTRREELAQAIPPAYTEFIGRQLIKRLCIK